MRTPINAGVAQGATSGEACVRQAADMQPAVALIAKFTAAALPNTPGRPGGSASGIRFIRTIANREGGSSLHCRQVAKVSPLCAGAERMLFRRWRDRHDTSAAQQLMRNHAALVVRIASGYRGCGLPLDDLIGEGYLGLMRAVCRFDPDCGVRFPSWAIVWVCAEIQTYILNSV